eukprot:1160099-Pelagomonas_calceolata.AAC.4
MATMLDHASAWPVAGNARSILIQATARQFSRCTRLRPDWQLARAVMPRLGPHLVTLEINAQCNMLSALQSVTSCLPALIRVKYTLSHLLPACADQSQGHAGVVLCVGKRKGVVGVGLSL